LHQHQSWSPFVSQLQHQPKRQHLPRKLLQRSQSQRRQLQRRRKRNNSSFLELERPARRGGSFLFMATYKNFQTHRNHVWPMMPQLLLGIFCIGTRITRSVSRSTVSQLNVPPKPRSTCSIILRGVFNLRPS